MKPHMYTPKYPASTTNKFVSDGLKNPIATQASPSNTASASSFDDQGTQK